MAAATIAVAHRLNIEVPRDLSVTGFDDTPIATAVWPDLDDGSSTHVQDDQRALGLIGEEVRLRAWERRSDLSGIAGKHSSGAGFVGAPTVTDLAGGPKPPPRGSAPSRHGLRAFTTAERWTGRRNGRGSLRGVAQLFVQRGSQLIVSPVIPRAFSYLRTDGKLSRSAGDRWVSARNVELRNRFVCATKSSGYW